MINTVKTFLVGAVTLTKNAVVDKYEYSGLRIRFDRRGGCPFPGIGLW